MSIFVGNTFIKKEDIRSTYSAIDEYDVDDIISGEETVSDSLICKTDFENVMDHIRDDVNQIIKILKNYDMSGAIDELEILSEKLY